MNTNPKVDFFFSQAGQWREAFEQLRTIILECGLNEELKWGQACYTLTIGSPGGRASKQRNIVLIHGFKAYCALLFFKGALMKDPKKILIQQTNNVQGARQIRFTDVREISRIKNVLKAYVREAIRVEEAGLKVEPKKTADFEVPEEFRQRLDKSAALRKAFNALTPGRQRAYLFYFSSAKQSKTRASRVEKYVEHILNGRGIDDK